MTAVVLPPLEQHPSPNRSARRAGVVPYLIVVHRPVGSYSSALRTLTDPAPGGNRDAAVSAHILTDSDNRSAQLVPWHLKAWAAAAFNSPGYHLEVDDAAWNGRDPAALATAARIVAYLCTGTGIPPVWTRDPANLPGVCRHYDLGRAGGGHTDPTTDVAVWTRFVRMAAEEFKRGGFRASWGTGHLARIDT